MKRSSIRGILPLSCLAWIILSSCEQKINIESVVHPDGSIDRSIVLAKADSNLIDQNMFGAGKSSGWETSVERLHQDSADKGPAKMNITFVKRYADTAAINRDMNINSDTLFRIKSRFTRTFRWFYTYIEYSDTYLAINRFTRTRPEEFFTSEDYAFIDRLPAEGKKISKADSVFLASLNTRLFDQFASQAIYDEYFDVMKTTLSTRVDKKWMDLLIRKKKEIYGKVAKKDGDLPDNLIQAVIDTLKIPVNAVEAGAEFKRLSVGLERRINFMQSANEGKYTHRIAMPWSVVDSNADSVAGSVLIWQPPVTKFLLRDYTMRAVSRQMNYIGMGISGIIVLATLFTLFWVRSRK